MKKFFAISLALVMSLSLLIGCGSQGAAGQDSAAGGDETYTLKLHIAVGENDPIGYTALKFKELVEERSAGKVTVEVYPSGTLGNTADCLEGLSLRICDVVFDGVANLAAYDSLANVDSVQYMYRDLEHYTAVYDGEVGQEYLAALGENTGKVLLGNMCTGVRQLTSTTPVRSVEDVKGLKLRVPASPMYTDAWAWLGASPMPIAGGEIFTSLQQGIIDGQENPYPTNVGLSVHEICKYVTETSHNYTTLSFMMDANFYQSLPADVQTILREAAEDAGKAGTEYAFEVAEEKKQVMVDAGCEIIEIDQEEWKAAMDGFLEEKYPDLLEWAERFEAVQP